ncbi:MAG: hypothetical protein O7A63_06045 [Acidobacteria bacterium]|nr:hypothetical protein [Acidobacteriota bacterium]
MFAGILLAALFQGCGGGKTEVEAPPAAKRFPSPLFDGLSLGMTRERVAEVRPIRPSLSPSGRSRRIWIYDSGDGHSAELTFEENAGTSRLTRIDVHFGPSGVSSDQYIARFSRRFGAPDVTHRKAGINAYGDHRHDQYDTIWSDATQYVFLTERVPTSGKERPVYYLTVKKKEITAAGAPTGYVPPPPPKGAEEGESIF